MTAHDVALERDAVKQDFMARRGFWAPAFEAMLQADHRFLAAYLELSCGPWDRGVLAPKVKEFIYIAADASTTHLHPVGTRSHIRAALRHGATEAEIIAVLQLVSLLGLQSIEFGTRLLATELGGGTPSPAVDAAQAFTTTVWGNPTLPEVTKHLVCLGLNASVTHLNAVQAQRHIRGALDCGATPAEVIEVFELVGVLGIHGMTMAVPILAEELAAQRDSS
jgi:alkylhydroperoxidase/carboxymuconolactone decarboxylase family protein YurZ